MSSAVITPASFLFNRAKTALSVDLMLPFKIICFKLSKMSITSSLTFKIVAKCIADGSEFELKKSGVDFTFSP